MATFTEEFLQCVAPQIASGVATPEVDWSKYTRLIMRRFPFVGSKIEWAQVPQSIEKAQTPLNAVEQGKAFMREEFERHGIDPTTPVVVVGDSSLDCAIRTTAAGMELIAGPLLEIPQHTYVISLDASWCMVFTMEGEMSFGFSPVPSAEL